MAKLTKQQRRELENVLANLDRAISYVMNDSTAICLRKRQATTTLDFTRKPIPEGLKKATDHMQPFTVIYVEPSEGLEIWQFFQCHADNDDHAEEQCRDAYPTCKVLWVNTGHGPQSQTMS